MAREKDSAKTKEAIFRAAEKAFSQKGLYGTRVDEIAKSAGINKRMIYEYYGCKVDLYREVLGVAYSRIASAGRSVVDEDDSYEEAIKKVVRFYFIYLNDNPAYVNLILWENLNKGEFISGIASDIRPPALTRLKAILERERKAGRIKKDTKPDQIQITLLTSTFAYFSNRYTLGKMLKQDLMKKESIDKRAGDLAEMLITYIKR